MDINDRPEGFLISFAENIFGKFICYIYPALINGSAKFGRLPVYKAAKELFLGDLIQNSLLVFSRLWTEAERSEQLDELLTGVIGKLFRL